MNIVAIGATDMNNLANAEIRRVRRIAVHPEYLSTGTHDITVLVLRQNSRIAPVQIATTQDLNSATQTTLAGFGNDDIFSSRGFGIKRKVTVDITALQRNAQDDMQQEEDLFGFESDYEFVAGGRGFDSCNGDSGGPAYISVNNTIKVAGLTSRATSNSQHPCGDGGIYVRIDKHMEFIKQIARESNITL
jgi:secreted trypsin-like serine protease